MKKTAIQRIVFLLLAAALLGTVWAWTCTPLDAGEVVLEDLDVVSGQENWQAFFRATRTGRPASVHLTVRYLADEGLLRPEDIVYEQDLVFDGKVYTISGETGGVDNGPYEEVYPYLLYFPNEPSLWGRYETVTDYILTEDDTLTHQEIWRRLLSSCSWDRIRCRTVYSDYVWREGMAP